MRGYKLAGMIMAGLLLFPWQIRGEDLTAVETEGIAIKEEDSIIIPEEETAFDVFEPDYPEDEEAGITEEFFSGAGLIEEENSSETFPDIPVTSFEEGGEILLDDPMTVEKEIIRGGRNEILLLSRDDQAMRYGSSYTGLFADQLQPDSRDFYDGMARYYALEEGNEAWTRTYSTENAPASFHTLFYPSGDSYTFIRTDDNGEYTEEYSSFLEDTAVVIQSAIDAFEYDYPDVFWIRPKSFRYSLTLVADEETIGSDQVTGTVYVTQITYVPDEAFSGALGYLTDYKAGKERVLAEIRQTADYDGDGTIMPSEYILADHDYLTSLLWYDAQGYRNRKKTGDYSVLTPAQTYIGSFRHGAVCEGYAKSFKSLCDAQGIACCLIGGSGHMWNGVCLDGEWHLVDCTWDDDEEGYSHDYLMTGKDSVHSSSGNFSNSSHTTIFCYPQLSGSAYHDYVLTESVMVLCTEAGSTTYTCLFCGDSYSEEIAPSGHEYVKTEKHATCTQKGSETYTCIKCGDTWSEEIPELGHDHEKSTVPPTCTQDGYTEYTCSRCDAAYRTDIQKTPGHDYKKTVISPTCEAGGYTKYVCIKCGHSFTGDRTQPVGHSFIPDDKESTPSTCTKKGIRKYRCQSCGMTRQEEIPLSGHVYRISKVDPTCTKEGYTLHTCSVCGYSRKSEKKNALGHDYQKSTLPATTQSGGYTRYTCKRCGYTCISNYTKPLSPPADAPKALSPVIQSVIDRNRKSESAAPVITTPESSDVVVLARAPILKKIKRKGKNRFQVAWKKNRKLEKRILGYEIEVCNNAAFKGNVNHYRLKKGKYKKTFKGKRKRTYYVRIRYYCRGGYSWWSRTKKIHLK